MSHYTKKPILINGHDIFIELDTSGLPDEIVKESSGPTHVYICGLHILIDPLVETKLPIS